MATPLEHASAFAGMVGSLALAVPFFVDYYARRSRIRRLHILKNDLLSGSDIDIIKRKFQDAELENILFADPWMAVCAGIGAVLLIISFTLLMI